MPDPDARNAAHQSDETTYLNGERPMAEPNAPDNTRAAQRAAFGSGSGPAPGGGSPLPSNAPAKVGRFEVRALLGEGAFGRVFRGYDADLKREVAIKVPHTAGLDDEFRERFVREARAIAAIHHPNVCPVFEVGTDGDLPFIVMRYVAGTTLGAVIDNLKTPMPPRNAAMIARKLALGMAAAHAQGVTHRDLKPANILYDTANREVLITDFGLARMGGEVNLTAKDSFLGTPAYTSPEQANRQMSDVGPLSDVYSLGVILYEMLTGDVPFNGSVMEVAIAHCITPPPPPSEKRPGLDPRLDAIVLRTMAKKPADRYPSAKALADALTDYLRPADGAPPGSAAAVELPSVAVRAVAAPTTETVAERQSGRRTAPAFEVVPPKSKPIVELDEDEDEDEDEADEEEAKEARRSASRKSAKQSKGGRKKKKKPEQDPLTKYAIPAVGGVLVVVALVLGVVVLTRDKDKGKDAAAKSDAPAKANGPAAVAPPPQQQTNTPKRDDPPKGDEPSPAEVALKNELLGRWRFAPATTNTLLTAQQAAALKEEKVFFYLDFKSDGLVHFGIDSFDVEARVEIAKEQIPTIPIKYRVTGGDKLEFTDVPDGLLRKLPPFAKGARPVALVNGDTLTLRAGTSVKLTRVVR